MAVILDTSAIFATADKSDNHYKEMVNFHSKNTDILIVPSTVIPEAVYLLNKRIGYDAELAFLNSLSEGEMQIEQFNENELERVLEILQKYNDLNIGFVDASIVAIAERLNINQLCTFDRNHFSAVRFKKKHFELLPQ